MVIIIKKRYIKYTIIILIVLVLLGIFYFSKNRLANINNKTGMLNKGILNEQVGIKEFYITANKNSFKPSGMTVAKGDKVKITFKNEEGLHDFKIDEFNVASRQSQAPNTDFLEFTADKTGNFKYYSSVGNDRKMGMEGILGVK